MSLRFRRSIRICKGVRLNFGKTGTSVSFGTKGMHYTVNSNGKRTVSVGVPGTGLYYSEVVNNQKRKTSKTSSPITDSSIDLANQSDIDRVQKFCEHINGIRLLHTNCGPTIAWNKIANRMRPFEGEIGPAEFDAIRKKENYKPTFLEKITGKDKKNLISLDEEIKNARLKDFNVLEQWKLKRERAEAILNKDIDAYLKVISETNPFEEVAEYGSEFEFGTDDPDVMYVRFDSNGRDVVPEQALKINERGKISKRKLTKTEYYDILQDYICSCSIKIARELFAILPISHVIINVEETISDDILSISRKDTVLSVDFSRSSLQTVSSFNMDPSELIEQYSDEYHMDFLKTKGFKAVKPIDRG